MFKNQAVKGYLFAFLAALTSAAVYIFSKDILNATSIFVFVMYWNLFAFTWNALYNFTTHKVSKKDFSSKKVLIVLLIFGLNEVLSTTSFYYAIKTIENPAIVAFFLCLNPVLITAFAMLFFKERFAVIEIAGIIIAIAGSVLLNYSDSLALSGFMNNGLLFILITVAASTASVLLVKSTLKNINPSLFALDRVTFLLISSAIIVFTFNIPAVVPLPTLLYIAAGAFIGPFISSQSGYTALKYIEATRYTIIQSTKSIYVLAGAYFYFNILPQRFQVIGGLLMLAGVIMVHAGKIKKATRNRIA